MAALFSHLNPLATPVGQLIEVATDGTQAYENWALYMEVCDKINETDEGPKDAIKAIRKRLSQNMGKNHTAVIYTLTCLETCVKNCGRRFHIHVANKDFLNDLVKVISPKYDPPQALQEKVLSMIQTWSDAFRGSPDMKDIEKVYQDLKAKGIEFPMTDLDNLAPIHTPSRTTGISEPDPVSVSTVRQPTPVRTASVWSPGHLINATPPATVLPRPVVGIPVVPTQEQLAKMRSELDVVQGNIRVMSEMLTELTPNNSDSSDLELLQELNRTNRQMQQRIVDLLDGIPNEEVTNELLRVNDDLNNVFIRYERFERYRTGQSGQVNEPESAEPVPSVSLQPPSYHESLQQPANPNLGNLIDLGEEPSAPFQEVTNQLTNTNISKTAKPAGDEDFDMFAQSRQSFDQSKNNLGSGNTYVIEDQFGQGLALGHAVNLKGNLKASAEDILKLQEKDADYDEMDQWLKQHEAATKSATEEPISSSDKDCGERFVGACANEFDEFLTGRASAASTLPSISAQTGTQQSRQSRQLKHDDDDNPMFAL